MASRLPLTDDEGEVRELTEADFEQAVPFSALPESLRTKLAALKTREPQKAPRKERIPQAGRDIHPVRNVWSGETGTRFAGNPGGSFRERRFSVRPRSERSERVE